MLGIIIVKEKYKAEEEGVSPSQRVVRCENKVTECFIWEEGP